MKRGNLVLRVVTALFFLAVLAYIGVYLYTSIENPFSVTTAVSATVYDSMEARGILIREEIPIFSDYDIIYVAAEEAKRLPNNGLIAYTYSGQEDLDRAIEIRNIKAQIEYLENYGSGSGVIDPLQLQFKLKDGIVQLKKAINNRELAALEDMSINLKTLAFFDGSETVDIQQSLMSLYSRLNELGPQGNPGAGSITAPTAGIFVSSVDGYEDISPDELDSLTPDSFISLMDENRMAEKYAIGKIICGRKWYYAAGIDADEAKSLSVGDSARLIFGRYYNEQLNMTIESVGDAKNGICIVVFSCNYALADTVGMRRQSAEILKAEYSGLKVPKKAIRLDEEGSTCVYVVTGLRAEKRIVNIIYESADYYLVAKDMDKTDSLRLGDSVIVSAKDLHDGKVVG